MIKHGQFLEINVIDNGCGIDHTKLAEIFDMFYTCKGESGTGLGLAVSKRLIEAHDGILTVESALGKGSKFTIRLPAY